MRKFKNHLFVVTLLPLIVLASCNLNTKKINSLQNENREKQAQISEQKLEIEKLNRKVFALEQNRNNDNSNDFENSNGSEIDNPNQLLNKQYYFIVLKITEKRIMNIEDFYSVTEVNEIGNFSESIRYKLLDKVVSNYMNSIDAKLYEGSVKQRNFYLFNSYIEASKAREKYIIN